MRIGQGYDAHRLSSDRAFVLGGVTIPFEKGLLGHSDADVLTHSIIDALLGAVGMGDIGKHFPDKNPEYMGASSILLLKEVIKLLKNYTVCNIDATVVAQAPKLEPYREAIRNNLADALGLSADKVNIKFKTEEGMGFTGNGEGVSAMAVALLSETGRG